MRFTSLLVFQIKKLGHEEFTGLAQSRTAVKGELEFKFVSSGSWVHIFSHCASLPFSQSSMEIWFPTFLPADDRTLLWGFKALLFLLPCWHIYIICRHHQLNGHELEQTPRDGGKQGSLVCFSPWVANSWTWLSHQTATVGSFRFYVGMPLCWDRRLPVGCEEYVRLDLVLAFSWGVRAIC